MFTRIRKGIGAVTGLVLGSAVAPIYSLLKSGVERNAEVGDVTWLQWLTRRQSTHTHHILRSESILKSIVLFAPRVIYNLFASPFVFAKKLMQLCAPAKRVTTPVIQKIASDNESKSINPASIKINTSSSPAKLLSCHHPERANETMPVYLSEVPETTILDYLDGDIGTQEEMKSELTIDQCQSLTFFGKNLYDLMAHRAAKLILSGEAQEADEVVMMISNHPALLDYEVEVIDPRGRSVKQKVFEIAFMAGDVDLKKGITEEKDKGLAERLAAAGGVSRARIKKAKEVLFSEEAKQQNANQNQRVLDAVIKFGEAIIKIQPNEAETDEKTEYLERLQLFRARCQPVIDQLEEDLKLAQSGLITLGYIFDPNILSMTDAWFAANVNRFGGWWSLQSDIFDVNGYGKLQGNLSSRDAQVTKSGIGNLVDKGLVPARSLKNSDGTSYFYNASSGLGSSFVLGYFGSCWLASLVAPSRAGAGGAGRPRALENLCRAKTTALQNLRNDSHGRLRVLAQ